MNRITAYFRRLFETMMEQQVPRRLVQYTIYMFLIVVIQNMLLVHIKPLDTCAFLLPSAVVAVGMFEGAVPGAIFGLVLGIFADMGFVESNIMFTLLFPFIAFATGFISQFFINRRFFAFMLVAAAAGLLTGCFQMLRVVVTDSFSLVMLRTVILQTLWSIPVAVIAYYPPAKWID